MPCCDCAQLAGSDDVVVEGGQQLSAVPSVASWRYVFDIDLPASPTVTWEWINSAQRQRQWQISADSIDMRHPHGVWGVGTTSHCAHGKAAIDHEVLDSKPFTYFTLRSTLAFWRALFTWELTPAPETEMTHLQIRVRPEQRLLTRLTTRLITARLRRVLGGDLANLARLLAAENQLPSSGGATEMRRDPSDPRC